MARSRSSSSTRREPRNRPRSGRLCPTGGGVTPSSKGPAGSVIRIGTTNWLLGSGPVWIRRGSTCRTWLVRNRTLYSCTTASPSATNRSPSSSTARHQAEFGDGARVTQPDPVTHRYRLSPRLGWSYASVRAEPQSVCPTSESVGAGDRCSIGPLRACDCDEELRHVLHRGSWLRLPPCVLADLGLSHRLRHRSTS